MNFVEILGLQDLPLVGSKFKLFEGSLVVPKAGWIDF